MNPRNERIRARYITLITDEGEKIENIETAEAIKMAYDKGLDLVLVAPKVQPPVAKIMDWGKYQYEITKKEQLSRKKQKSLEQKEIRLRPKTDIHDLQIKMKKIKEFLEKGHKVKIVMMFRGREAAYINKGKENMNKIVEEFKDIAEPEDKMSYQFKRLSITISPLEEKNKDETKNP